MKDRNRKNVFLLGLTSFFNDISSETISALLPLYLGSLGMIGFLGGVIHGLGEVTKVYFGYMSDRMGKRTPIVTAGYLLSILSRFFVTLVSKPFLVFVFLADRLGKGVREGPRDAILSQSRRRGWAFGIQKAMDTAGAIIGSLAAFTLVYLSMDFKRAMVASAYVGVLALVPLLFVRAKPFKPTKLSFSSTIKSVPVRLKRFGIVVGLFGLVLISPLILIKTSYDAFGTMGLLLYVAFNIFYAGASEILGDFSDRYGRSVVLNFSFLTASLAFLLVYLDGFWIIPGFIIYGLAFGAFKSTSGALASDISGQERGTALGLVQTIGGFAVFLGSSIFGILLGTLGQPTYLLASLLSLVSMGAYRILEI